jgi:hypothetical protein
MYFITNFLVSRDHVLTLHSQSPQSREYSEVKKGQDVESRLGHWSCCQRCLLPLLYKYGRHSLVALWEAAVEGLAWSLSCAICLCWQVCGSSALSLHIAFAYS